MESTIVRSVLENDLYKFSMSYYYQRTTPEGIGTFSFNDRNGMKFTPEFVDLLRKEFKKLETLALTDEEFKWCLSNIYFIPQCYFEWLKGFRSGRIDWYFIAKYTVDEPMKYLAWRVRYSVT